MAFDNRVTQLLGVDIPIFSAPMGGVAVPELVAAVSEAGAMGLVPGSLGKDRVRDEIRKVRDLTDKPFGVNVPLAFVRDPAVVETIIGEGIRFMTTSAGSPDRYTPLLKEAGITVFHVVPTLRAAVKAVNAGVDGLVVEGNEGAGFKNPREVSTLVLVPLVAQKLDVPIVAAGGVADGRSLAAVMALGAEGAQLGTRMLATVESGVHPKVKQAVVAAQETDTLLINKQNGKPMRVLRTQLTSEWEFATEGDPTVLLAKISETYVSGDLEASLQQLGQVAGRVDELLPAGEVIRRAVAEYDDVVSRLAAGIPVGAA